MKTFVPIIILATLIVVGCRQKGSLGDIQDMDLKKAILDKYDRNKDFALSKDEVDLVTVIQVPSRTTTLSGLEMLSSLASVTARRGLLRDADVSRCRSLKSVTITDMPNLKTIVLPQGLTSLVLGNVPIASIGFDGLKNLQTLTIVETKIENLDVSMLKTLDRLSCNYIGLKTLTISKQQKISELDVAATTTIIYVD